MFFAFFAVDNFAQIPESLSEKINYGDSEQRRDALLQIKILQSEEASRLAIPLLSDSTEVVRATAVSAIIYLSSEEAVNLLLPLLQDKSELVRRETAYALGKVRNPHALNTLLQVSKTDKILEVRTACVIALGEIGDISAMPALTEILTTKPKDEEEFLRRAAARSIGQIAQIIQSQQFEVVTPTSFLPDKFKVSPKNPPTNEKPGKVESSNTVKGNFLTLNGEAVVLVKVLKDPKESDDTRREAAFALGETRDNLAISVLTSNLNNPDYYLAEICKEALEKFKLK